APVLSQRWRARRRLLEVPAEGGVEGPRGRPRVPSPARPSNRGADRQSWSRMSWAKSWQSAADRVKWNAVSGGKGTGVLPPLIAAGLVKSMLAHALVHLGALSTTRLAFEALGGSRLSSHEAWPEHSESEPKGPWDRLMAR